VLRIQRRLPTSESAEKAQQETSIVDKEQPDGVDQLEATIEINQGVFIILYAVSF
jgi:hypothetical protein